MNIKLNLTEMKDKLLTIQEVADDLRLNRFTVYRLAESGDLPGFQVTVG